MRIEFKNVSVLYENKKRDVVTAIDDVSFSFEDGAFNVVVGPSGCGKTSLLKCITSSLYYEGQISFNNIDIETIPLKNRKIAYMSENYAIFPHMNVYDNIAFPLRTHKVDHDEADQLIKHITSILDIDYLLTRKSKFLSLGQISRVALAKILVEERDLYLFDEPTSNLDEPNRVMVDNYIKEQIKEKKKTVVFVTHNIQEALLLADYIYVFDNGKFINKFTPTDFLKSQNEVVVWLRSTLEKEIDE